MILVDRIERIAVFGVLLVAASLLFVSMDYESSLRALDWPLHDRAQRHLLRDPPPTDDVVVVLLDDESLLQIGSWPIPREKWGDFIALMQGYGAASVGLDIWFETPAPRAEVDLAMDVADKLRSGPLAEDLSARFLLFELDQITVERDGDRRFAEALASYGRAVLGAACDARGKDVLQAGDLAVPLPSSGTPEEAATAALRCRAISANTQQLAMSARAQAGVEVQFDADHRIRRYPYRFGTPQGVHPLLALAATTAARPDQEAALMETVAPFLVTAPVLRFQPSTAFRTIRFSDILMSPPGTEALDKALRDKIVLLGVSVTGTEDLRNHPVEDARPGVYVHANAVENLLHGGFIRTTGAPVRGGAAAGFVLLLAMVAIGRRLQSPLTVTALAAATVAVASVGFVVALQRGWWVPWSPIALGAVAWAVVRGTAHVFRLQADRKRAKDIKNAFQFYLAPAVIDALVANPDLLKLGGTRKNITAFFSDVAGFTTISETLNPTDLVQLLNECLGAMTDIILDEGGTIDKYIGDAIVAMFGAPLEQPDHAARAVRAALRCQQKLDELRPDWIARGLPEVVVRIGLNTGDALVGNMGSTRRFDYTMLGDTVNLAARLESANKAYESLILIGDKTAKALDDSILVREADLVMVKGKTTGIAVHQPVAIAAEATPEQRDRTARFKEALIAYRAQRWDDARRLFRQLETEGDGTAGVMLHRIDDLEKNPPPADWDGVYTMKTK